MRNRLVPVPERVTAFLQATPAGREALPEAIRGWMKATLGEAPPVDAWDGADLPPHLVVNVRVVDAAGKELGSGRDLAALRAQLGEAAQMTFAATGQRLRAEGTAQLGRRRPAGVADARPQGPARDRLPGAGRRRG